MVNSLFPAQHSAMFEYTPSVPPPYGFVPWNDQKSITARVSSSAKTYPSVEIDLVIAAMSRIVMVDAVAMSLPAERNASDAGSLNSPACRAYLEVCSWFREPSQHLFRAAHFRMACLQHYRKGNWKSRSPSRLVLSDPVQFCLVSNKSLTTDHSHGTTELQIKPGDSTLTRLDGDGMTF